MMTLSRRKLRLQMVFVVAVFSLLSIPVHATQGEFESISDAAGSTGAFLTGAETLPVESDPEPTGDLSVEIVPVGVRQANAMWRVDGGGWLESGATVSVLPVGRHMVEFTDIMGWVTPANQEVEISNGQTTSVSGTYDPQTDTGALIVVITPWEAVTAGALWQLDGGAWNNSGSVVSGLTPGTHNLVFRSVNGWSTPSPRTVTISKGITSRISGDYVLRPYSPEPLLMLLMD